MSIKETLNLISKLAQHYNIDKPYIVGGLPRDIYLKKSIKTNDVDLTTNSLDVLRLGVLVADKFNVPFELSEDGHVTAFLDEFDVDFSSHFISKKVEEYLDGNFIGFEEAFSRDFTINTLHQELSAETFFDPTQQAIEDLEAKVIRTPVPVEITFTDDPRRAYRAINLAVRYDFSIDQEIIDFIHNNLELFNSDKVKDKYITLKINKALYTNPEKTIDLLRETKLFPFVPLVGQFKEFLIQNKLLSEYLNFGNITKVATYMAKNWQDYSAQGPDYKKIENWWKSHYQHFPKHKSPEYSAWTAWYAEELKTDWHNQHKGPKETLVAMEEEASGGSKTFYEIAKEKVSNLTGKLPSIDTIWKTPAEAITNYTENIGHGSAVDIVNVTPEVKSFLSVLGQTAKEMGAEKPYVTSGYRSIEKQAKIMLFNWKENGGLAGGKEYLISIYGKTYGNAVAKEFEKYGYTDAASAAIIPIIERYGGRHIKIPCEAVDLRLTDGITEVLGAINKSNRFKLKLVDERKTAGPHWHVTVMQDNGLKT